ncbi:hypothetical protein, partial [Streptomyces sp. JW3]|uniref:hypothetical protein n=1 Tax=Streptomyces sp. JW3 TaxID=3456955 RepID=UPI003FA4A110
MPDAAARHGPGRPGPPGADPFAELVRTLREAGLDPDAEQLCDALWLAGWARRADPADVPVPRAGRPAPPRLRVQRHPPVGRVGVR